MPRSPDKKCPKNKIVNPKTGRCVLKNGKIGKTILKEQKDKKSPRKSPRKSPIRFVETNVVVTGVDYNHPKVGKKLDKLIKQFNSRYGMHVDGEFGGNGWWDVYRVQQGKVRLFKKEFKNFWENKIDGTVILNPKKELKRHYLLKQDKKSPKKSVKINVVVTGVDYSDSKEGDRLEKLRNKFKSKYGKYDVAESGNKGWWEVYIVEQGNVKLFKKDYKNYWEKKINGRVLVNPNKNFISQYLDD